MKTLVTVIIIHFSNPLHLIPLETIQLNIPLYLLKVLIYLSLGMTLHCEIGKFRKNPSSRI